MMDFSVILSAAGAEAPSMPLPAPKILWESGWFRLTETMVSALVTAAVILLFAAIIRIFLIPRWRQKDSVSFLRMALEGLITMFDTEAEHKTEEYHGFVGAWFFGCSTYICVGVLMDLFGLRPPISSLGQTLVLGLCTFLIIFVLGFHKKKLRRFLHYINPIYIITDAVVPFSMALRLFGAVYSGYLVMHLIYSIGSFGILPLTPIASVIFTLFHALIQSYIFMLLSMSFVQEAVEIQPKAIKEKKLKKV